MPVSGIEKLRTIPIDFPLFELSFSANNYEFATDRVKSMRNGVSIEVGVMGKGINPPCTPTRIEKAGVNRVVG